MVKVFMTIMRELVIYSALSVRELVAIQKNKESSDKNTISFKYNSQFFYLRAFYQ